MAGRGSRIAASIDRFFARPPGWVFHIALFLAVAVTLWWSSYPGFPDVFFFVLFGYLWITVGGPWLARFVVYLGNKRGIERGSRIRWAIAPVLVITTVALMFFQVPLRLRFDAARSDLEGFAAEVQPSNDVDVGAREHVGTFVVLRWSIDKLPNGGVRFLVDSGGLGGFAYSPSGRPRQNAEDRYYHLEGPWYVWQAGFD